MKFLPSLARLSLAAALLLPALAFFPPSQHGFEVPKQALWQILAPLAAALAWALPPPAEAGPGARRRMGLALLAAAALALLQVLPLSDLGLFRAAAVAAALALAVLALWPGRGAAAGLLPRLALGLAAWWCLAAAYAPRPDVAGISLLNWGGYLFAFAAAWRLGGEASARRLLIGALLLGAALNAAWGLLQGLGYNPGPWDNNFAGRASACFGNPNYLGGHLALLLPPALALALGSAGLRRIAFGALALLLALGLAASQTRGAWAGAGLGCALALVLVARRMSWRGLLAGLGLLAALLCASWFLLGEQGRQRLLGSEELRAQLSMRQGLWTRSTELAIRHPVLGVGPGGFRLAFPEVQALGPDRQLQVDQAYVYSEHAHNDLLQMAAEAGWPAAALWLALLASAFAALGRGLSRAAPEQRPLLAGALGGLAALSLHGLANFPFLVIPTQAAAWALVALALRAATPSPALAPASGEGRPSAALAWGGSVLAGVLILVQVRALPADALWWRGEGELKAGHADAAVLNLQAAVDLLPREDRLWFLLGRAQQAQGRVPAGLQSWSKALALNPFDAQTRVALGQAWLAQGLPQQAFDTLAPAAAWAPNAKDLWQPLAAASFQVGRYEDALRAYDYVLHFRLSPAESSANKAAALGNLGRLQEALDLLQQAERSYPGNPVLARNRVVTLWKLGRKPEARRAWAQAQAAHPEDEALRALGKALGAR